MLPFHWNLLQFVSNPIQYLYVFGKMCFKGCLSKHVCSLTISNIWMFFWQMCFRSCMSKSVLPWNIQYLNVFLANVFRKLFEKSVFPYNIQYLNVFFCKLCFGSCLSKSVFPCKIQYLNIRCLNVFWQNVFWKLFVKICAVEISFWWMFCAYITWHVTIRLIVLLKNILCNHHLTFCMSCICHRIKG